MTVLYHEAAEQELLHAVGYLEMRAKGLGRRLLADVRKAEDRMTRFPESAPEIVPGIRRLLLQKFPYSLFYTIENGDLLILAVAHQRRRPGYWVSRLSPTEEGEA
jgi:plasmid stabilization system protein ParE